MHNYNPFYTVLEHKKKNIDIRHDFVVGSTPILCILDCNTDGTLLFKIYRKHPPSPTHTP
jgi:hypothetical protein